MNLYILAPLRRYKSFLFVEFTKNCIFPKSLMVYWVFIELGDI